MQCCMHVASRATKLQRVSITITTLPLEKLRGMLLAIIPGWTLDVTLRDVWAKLLARLHLVSRPKGAMSLIVTLMLFQYLYNKLKAVLASIK